MVKPENINDDNLLTVDLEEVVRDQRFKDLNFIPIREKLARIQKWLKELQSFDFNKILGREELNRIAALRRDLNRRLNELNTFEIRTTHETAPRELETATSQVESLYDSASQILIRVLQFLRQETARTSSDTEELQRQQREAADAKKEYDLLKEEIARELGEIRARRSEVEQSQGEILAVSLGRAFETQADYYEGRARVWLRLRIVFLSLLGLVVAANVLAYIIMFVLFHSGKSAINPESIFTAQYALAKIALLALLSYAVGFSSRNYNINKGLAATNRHRKNVAETLLSALTSQLPEATKSVLTAEAAAVMFTHLPVGYIHRENQADFGPIGDILRRVVPGAS